MKITFVTSTLTSGGAERVISLLANEFARRNNEVEMICLTSISPDFYAVDNQVRLIHADKECGGGLLNELIWFRKHIKYEKPDVVIAFMEAVYEFVLMALLGMKIPIISSERKDPTKIEWHRKILRWFLLPTTTRHVVQTRKIRDFYNIVIRKKTVIIYNPVNEKVFDKKLCNEPHAINRIVSVGRLYPQKRQKMMMDAFAMVASDYPDWQLVIYGEGYMRAELEEHILSLNMKNRILLPGRTNRVIEEVAASKIFCLSSDWEGMSNAMIEAMCVGTPIISTRVSGTEELITNGENGLLVDIGDTEELANAFRVLMGNEKLRFQFGEKSKEMSSLFALDSIVNQWEELVKEIAIES